LILLQKRKPFLSFNVQSVDEKTIQELSKFHKDNFSVDGILEAAGRSKNTKDAADFIRAQLNEPSDDFVKIVAKNVKIVLAKEDVVAKYRPLTNAD
jgi:hypothetical protein